MTQCYCTGECIKGVCPNADTNSLEKIHTECKKSYYKIFDILRKETESECVWDTLSPEDRNKPIGLSCPCKKCSPWSM